MKKMNNKGFSLIELIIVIAIMAVLVAVIAPNLTGYIAKSKTNADKTNADTIEGVITNELQNYTTDSTMAFGDTAGTTAAASTALLTGTSAAYSDLNTLMTDAKAADAGTFLGNVYSALKKYADNSGQINCKVTANKFWLKIEGSYDTGFTCKVQAADANTQPTW